MYELVVNSSIVRGPDDFGALSKIPVNEKHLIDSAALRYELRSRDCEARFIA